MTFNATNVPGVNLRSISSFNFQLAISHFSSCSLTESRRRDETAVRHSPAFQSMRKGPARRGEPTSPCPVCFPMGAAAFLRFPSHPSVPHPPFGSPARAFLQRMTPSPVGLAPTFKQRAHFKKLAILAFGCQCSRMPSSVCRF